MADFATALRSRLIADADVAAVAGTRIYWGEVPQGAALPYVRLSSVSDPRPEHLKGYDANRLTTAQASCFAMSYGAARQLAVKIINALALPTAVSGGAFGRVKGEGPFDEQGDDTPNGYIHHARVDLRAEHNLA